MLLPAVAAKHSTDGMISAEVLKKGNRDQIVDYYVAKNLTAENADFSYKILTRLNASKKTIFQKVSFVHAVFEGCYFNQCFFDSCDFTGARFIGCNFHQTSFAGCKFAYATFERCQIDDDILSKEAPLEDNLKMRFARTLRMNYQQIGDAKAVNHAISFELQATESYLYKSWASGETYYREKYRGIIVVRQFWRWTCFRLLDLIWGNGESVLKLLRSFLLAFLVVGLSEGATSGDPWNLRKYLMGLQHAPAIFFGVSGVGSFGPTAASVIAATRLVGMAFLTAILIKRLGRR
ncbi:pentapeptide repeat-containing protein [Paraburkholderia azotifigens]|uniref:pentapeptide repeat-containing protein n=1 Tax=Paraburkholderia azotifigens TaxID=2057004 RepID=UPI00317CBF38